MSFWWDFLIYPCRVSWIVTTPQPWYWAFIANTSRFCGHTKSYLARRFSEIIWKHLKLSDDFRRILKTSEFIWIHLKIFWILMIFWKQMKLSEIIWWFPALSEIATSKTWAECVFFSQKKNDTAQRHRQGVRGTCAPVCCDKVQFLLL